MAGIYIHIPFCSQLCSYCDFHFSLSLSRKNEMIDSICKEMQSRKAYLNGEKINTMYIGGGTPSLLSYSELYKLISTAQEEYNFTLKDLSEFTIECNPEDLTLDYLQMLRELGCNRLSIGIQSFDDNVLKFMNRRHSSSRALRAVSDAKMVGFKNISIDIIFGVPDVEELTVIKDIETAISCNVNHISAYHLTIENKTVLGQLARKGQFAPISEELSDSHYHLVENMLTKAGYNHYEVSNYAKEGHEAIHNGNYWRGEKYIGFGPSAHSFDGVSRQWNISGNIRYIDLLGNSKEYFDYEELSPTDMYNEYIMTALRTSRGLSLNEIRNRWGASSVEYLLSEGKKLIDKGLLKIDGDRVYINSSDFLLSDSIISEIMNYNN